MSPLNKEAASVVKRIYIKSVLISLSHHSNDRHVLTLHVRIQQFDYVFYIILLEFIYR